MPWSEGPQEAPDDRGRPVVLPGGARARLPDGGEQNVFGGKFKSRNPIFQNNQGHCLIVPLSHVKCATLLDEDVAAEVAEFKSALAAMFRSNGGEVSTHS